MSIAQVFASTIQQLATMSLAELVQFKLQVAEKAFADRGEPGDPDTPRADIDDGDSPFHDATTESYFALLDLVDQEIEKRRAGPVTITQVPHELLLSQSRIAHRDHL